MAQTLTLAKARGSLTATPNTVVLTVSGGYTVRIYGTFCNTGSSNRNVFVECEGVRIFHGDTNNSPLKPGQTLEIDLPLRLEDTDEITAWQDSGTDVDFYLTVGIHP